MKAVVYYTVMFRVEVDIDNDQVIDDAISDIDIPENDSKYVDDSVDLVSVELMPGEVRVNDTTLTPSEVLEGEV